MNSVATNEVGLTLRDITREPQTEPCPDCGRTYLNGENVTMTVPGRGHRVRVVWSGCADCWVRRTNPVEAEVRAQR